MANLRDGDLFLEPDPIDREENFEWKMLRPKPGRKFAVTCLSTTKFGTRTYWTKGGTLPFLKSQEGDGTVRTDIRWHGYFQAVLHPTLRLVVVEMTERAAEMLTKGIQRFKTMRGLDITLERDGDANNSPQVLTVKRINPYPGDLPAEVPILPILKRIWQMPDKKLIESLADVEVAAANAQREIEKLGEQLHGPDTQWMNQRIKDLEGQLILPLNGSKR